MDYFPAQLVGREFYHPGLFKIRLDRLPIRGEVGELAGRYFFLFIPGVGEKPFAICSADEKSIIVRVAGRFTKLLGEIAEGTRIYLRGPYGSPFPNLEGHQVVMIGGGTGTASLYEIGRKLQSKNELVFLLGGRSAQDLFGLKEFSRMGTVRVATNDGSEGHSGFVTDLLAEFPEAEATRPRSYIACGPEPMVEAAFKKLEGTCDPERIWGSIEI
jgi:dihydroorotate dehydrogenase (NAD+) catalytic subunit